MYGLLVSSLGAPATVVAVVALDFLLLLPHAARISSGTRASDVNSTRRRERSDGLIPSGSPPGRLGSNERKLVGRFRTTVLQQTSRNAGATILSPASAPPSPAGTLFPLRHPPGHGWPAPAA